MLRVRLLPMGNNLLYFRPMFQRSINIKAPQHIRQTAIIGTDKFTQFPPVLLEKKANIAPVIGNKEKKLDGISFSTKGNERLSPISECFHPSIMDGHYCGLLL